MPNFVRFAVIDVHEAYLCVPRRSFFGSCDRREYYFKEKDSACLKSPAKPSARQSGKADQVRQDGQYPEAECQIITDYEVIEKRPVDADPLLPSIETRDQLLWPVPKLVACGSASTARTTKSG
jgi:hypothetical protein